MNERTTLATKLIVSHLLPVLALILASLFFEGYTSLLLIISQVILLILLLAGYWEFFGQKLKWFFFGINQVANILVFILKVNSQPVQGNDIVNLCLLFILLFLLFILAKILLVIFKKDSDNIEIDFPLRDGSYLVTDGGNSKRSRLMNYHYGSKVHKTKGTSQSMLYATDIVKMGKGKHFFPRKNVQYPVWNEKLYCPMDGIVCKVISSIDDNTPFSGNYPYNTGNTVVIQNGNLYLLLGHLQKGSIQVVEGSTVKKGDIFARVGNSGMSERPHLHMQLMRSNDSNYWKGIGINIKFQGKNLYKNRIIKNC
jgi:hypothetical protein